MKKVLIKSFSVLFLAATLLLISCNSLSGKKSSATMVRNEIFTVSNSYSHPKLFNKDNSVNITFCGNKYNIPNSKLSEFVKNGVVPVDDELSDNIKPKSYKLSWRQKGSVLVNLDIANFTDKSIKPEDGNVAEVSFLPGWIEEYKNYELPQKITIGSTVDEVRAAYGKPEFIKIGTAGDSPDYISYEYHQGDSIVTLYFQRNSYQLFNFSVNAIPFDYTNSDT